MIIDEEDDEVGEVLKFPAHVGMASGKFTGLHAGGYNGRWEFLVVGPAMQQITCVDLAKQGELCISARSWELLALLGEGAPTATSEGGEVPYLLTALKPYPDDS